MDLRLEPIDLLTKAQKQELAKQVYDKFSEAIAAISFKKGKLDLTKFVISEIEATLRDQYVQEFVQYDKIGKIFSKIIMRQMQEFDKKHGG